MAGSTTMAVSSKKSKFFITEADDAVIDTEAKARDNSNFSTGDISGIIKTFSMPINSSSSDETVIDAPVGQTHKDIPNIALSVTWKATSPARTRAIDYVLQDSDKEYTVRASFDGTGTGEVMYWGQGVFLSTTPSGAARSAQQADCQFVFNTFYKGTHA